MNFTNSDLVSLTKLSVHHSGAKKHPITRITPHVYEGQRTIEEMANFFYEPDHTVSCNYAIDKNGKIALIVEEKNRSWCSSNAENDDTAITVECASDSREPYTVNQQTFDSLINLCADICKRYNKTKLIWIPNKTEALKYIVAENEILLTVHRWLFNTSCPGTWMMNHMEELAERVNAALSVKEPTGEELQSETEINVEPKLETKTEPITDKSTNPVSTDTPTEKEVVGFQTTQLVGLSNQQVIDLVAPLFIEDQKKSGILASVSLAQFLLETGYGRTVLCQAANNGFGMKTYLSGNTWSGSTWDGSSSYVMSTQEQNPDGSYFTYTEAFRKYPCLEDSISDHSAYLLNAPNGDKLRYQGLQGCKNYKHAFEIIYNGGYATSLTYVKELCMVVEMWNLTKYDIITQQEFESNSQTSNAPNIEISAQDEIDKNNLLDQIIKLLADINKILLELRDK